MAKNYLTLDPDKMYRLGRHYTPGRAGQKIEFITRHHLMYIGEVEDVVNNIWNTRQASAHVVIGPTGRWGQAVYDRDTAWANANQWANQRTLAIEHSNNTGRFTGGNDYHDKSWNISDATLKEGARVAASYCLHEKLGAPKYGTTIRDHNEFTSTGCPVHLQGPRPGNAWGGKAGKYHYQWMEESTGFYNDLSKGLVDAQGNPINHFKKETSSVAFTDDDRKKLDQIHHELTHRFQSRYPESKFRETLMGYLLEIDKKIENLQANQVPNVWNKVSEIRDYLNKKGQ